MWLSLSLPPLLGESILRAPSADSDTSPEVTTPSPNSSDTFTCAAICP